MSYVIRAYEPSSPQISVIEELDNSLEYAKKQAFFINREYPELSVVVCKNNKLFAFYEAIQ